MARLHVLQSNGINQYDVVVHSPVPAGANSAGVSWATCLVVSGMNKTSLAIGEGPGQIGQVEADAVVAGTVLETRFAWGDDVTWTNQQRIADLDVRAAQAVEQALADLAGRLKFFGYEVS